MKKVAATLTALAVLSMSVVPTFAKGDHGFNGKQINIHFQENNNTNIDFSDIDNSWAKQYIQDLVKKGVLHGVDSKHFNPNGSVSRADWAVMVSKYFGLTSSTTTQDFQDVPTNSYAYPYVEAMKDYFDAFQGLNGTLMFEPQKAATRQDVTVTLVKVLAQMDSSVQVMDATSANTLLQQQFSDWNSISPALRPYVATAVQDGLIHGDGNGHFRPQASLSRAEAATLLDMLLNSGIVVDGGGTNPVVPGNPVTTSTTTLTSLNTAVVTGVNNTTHVLGVANGISVATLESDLSVGNGTGNVAVYTDNTETTVAPATAIVSNAMVVVATAQDGSTQQAYTITLPGSNLDSITTLTTTNNAVVTAIDNTNDALTVNTGTTVQTLKNDLFVDGGKGKVTVYTDNTETAQAATTATVNGAMVVVATAQDGVTTTVYTIGLTSPLSAGTSLTTNNNAVVTNIDNTNHVLTLANGTTTVQALKGDLYVDGGLGTVAVYTDSTETTLATTSADVTGTMVLVASAQDGVTKQVYTISAPIPASHATTLTTIDNSVVTGIDNTHHLLTIDGGTTVQTLEDDLSVDNGNGTLAVYTDNTKTTVADPSATLTNSMVVVATAQDGTTKVVYTMTV